MTRGIQIRHATATDSGRISELLCSLSSKFITPELTAEGEKVLLDSMSPKAIGNYMRSGFRYHVAETAQRIIGVAGVSENKHLFHLFVAESFQRQGVARHLWRVAMQECLGNGNPGIFTVNSSEYAQRVYEKLGFLATSAVQEKDGVRFVPMQMTITSEP